jgi:hypothetical protein
MELTEVAVALETSLSGISVLTILGRLSLRFLDCTFPILFLIYKLYFIFYFKMKEREGKKGVQKGEKKKRKKYNSIYICISTSIYI